MHAPHEPDLVRTARVAIWDAMTPEQRRDALYCLIWSRDEGRLSVNDLVEIVAGKHGYLLAQRFVDTLRRGLGALRTGGQIASFADLCLRWGRRDVLEPLVEPPSPVVFEGMALSKSDWLDHLCTRESGRRLITKTLYQVACDLHPTSARFLFRFALKHQPEHPHIAQVINSGHPNAAILAELVMARRIASQLESREVAHSRGSGSGESLDSLADPDSVATETVLREARASATTVPRRRRPRSV